MTNTNFFQSIAAQQVAGDWTITIARDTADRYVVSVLFFNNAIGDEARKQVQPILLKGTKAELDEGFFAAIEAPVKETEKLFTNMEQYLKTQEQAKINSKMEKDKTDKDEGGKEKDEKYTAAMQKVEELEAAGNFQLAIASLPKPEQFKNYAKEIKEKLEQLRKKNQPTLL